MPAFTRITRDPNIMSGRPCIRDTRVAVSTILSLMANGRSEVEVARRFPALSLDDIREAMTFAAWEIDPEGTAQDASREAARPVVAPPARYLHPPRVNLLAPHASAEGENPDAPASNETIEFFHPSRPDQPTILLTSHGIIDRRWSTGMIAWSDIREIRRIPGEKTIVVTLRNPGNYISSLSFFPWILARIRLVFNLRTLYLDTSSLGLRTQVLLNEVMRLWIKHRGKKRKKRRIKGHHSHRDRSLIAESYQAE